MLSMRPNLSEGIMPQAKMGLVVLKMEKILELLMDIKTGR